jgi:hypothetical protein
VTRDEKMTAALAAADQQLALVEANVSELVVRARAMLATTGRTQAWAALGIDIGRNFDCRNTEQRWVAGLVAAAVLRLAESPEESVSSDEKGPPER